MVTGRRPFQGRSSAEIASAILRDKPAAIAEVRADVPDDLARIIRRCLEKDPRHRIQTARDVANELRDLARHRSEPEAPAALASARADGRAHQSGRRPSWRRHALPIAGAALILLAGAAYLGTRSGLVRPAPAATGDALAPAAIRSIAVLPLDNYSGDPGQDYFAEGMTDELTTQLATISRLRVISRGSAMQFKGANRPPTPEIAKALDVDAIVEGSVLRSGEKVRITAQLIDARADRHLWARSFERSSRDVLALQAELASAIAGQIHAELTPAGESRLASAPRINPEAYDAYLKGRYFFNRPSDENLQKAIARFEEAVALEPGFAPAHSGLSDAYLWAGYNEGFLTASESRPKAKAAAEKAIQLDDASAEAHTSLANFKLWYEYDWEGSETAFRRALELNPSYAYARDQFGMGLAFQGKLEEAVAEGKRAAELESALPQIPSTPPWRSSGRGNSRRRAGWCGGHRTSTRPYSWSRGLTGGSSCRPASPRSPSRGSRRPRPWGRRRSSPPGSRTHAGPLAIGPGPRPGSTRSRSGRCAAFRPRSTSRSSTSAWAITRAP